MKPEDKIPDAVWVQDGEALLKDLLSKPPCTHNGEDCVDKLLIALLSGTATRIEQTKVALWLQACVERMTAEERQKEIARGIMLLLVGPRGEKIH